MMHLTDYPKLSSLRIRKIGPIAHYGKL